MATTVTFQIQPELISGITPRQREILVFVANGYKTDEIAKALKISPLTVKTLRNTIYKNINAKNVADATLIAIRSGLVRLA